MGDGWVVGGGSLGAKERPWRQNWFKWPHPDLVSQQGQRRRLNYKHIEHRFWEKFSLRPNKLSFLTYLILDRNDSETKLKLTAIKVRDSGT